MIGLPPWIRLELGLRPWIRLEEGRVLGFFPAAGVHRGQMVLVDGVRAQVVRVDYKRNRVKVKPRPIRPLPSHDG